MGMEDDMGEGLTGGVSRGSCLYIGPGLNSCSQKKKFIYGPIL